MSDTKKICTVYYQGIAGSFSHLAARAFFGDHYEYVGTLRFRDIFTGVIAGAQHFGFVPVENSIAGSVYENMDHLAAHPVTVIGEHYLRVEHQLLGISVPGVSAHERIAQLRRAYSHPKALEQCVNFFEEHPWIEKVEYSDTARAAELVAGEKDPTLAAIASREAATLYGVVELAGNIEDNHQNYTRFFAIATARDEAAIAPSGTTKWSLILTLAHQSGSLLKVLAAIFEANGNLTRVESRPIVGRPFEYVFYVDFEITADASAHGCEAALLRQIKPLTSDFRLLGNYPASTIPLTVSATSPSS